MYGRYTRRRRGQSVPNEQSMLLTAATLVSGTA